MDWNWPFNYCANLGYYEFLIQIKIREIKAARIFAKK